MERALSLQNVCFSYFDKSVINDLSFELESGKIFGFLGPNGSGKTTTIRLINGVLKAQKGNINVFAKPIYDNLSYVHQLSGVLTESANLYKNLTGKENILFFANLRGLNKREIEENFNWITKRLELSTFMNKKFKDMSTGMKKRIALAVALIHKPLIAFLDEPSTGLDPETNLMLRDLIKELKKEYNCTIFLSTHLLKEAEEICDVFGLLKGGKLVAFGEINDLVKNIPNSIYLKIRGKKPKEFDLLFDEVEKNIYHIYPVDFINIDEFSSQIIDRWIKKGGKIYEAKIERWNLERIYFSF